MSATNKRALGPQLVTHEGGRATPGSALQELRRNVLCCLLWEPSFYEGGDEAPGRIAKLVPQCKPEDVAALAIEARDKFYLRHVPLFLLCELSKVRGAGPIVRHALAHCVQRADELAETLAIYWKDVSIKPADSKRPIAASIKKGLADAFPKFNAYQLAKYNRDNEIKLRDVAFLVHPRPQNSDQAIVWARLMNKDRWPKEGLSPTETFSKLEAPDTWEVALSAGKDKKSTFERLLREKKLGALALLRNLRNMQEAKVDTQLMADALALGGQKLFPYRYVVAAKYAPALEPYLELGMYKALEGVDPLSGSTGLLIDVSGSMDHVLHDPRPGQKPDPNPTSRIDAAAGLAILLRERCGFINVATFSEHTVIVPSRRGFALRDAIRDSQSHSYTYLRRSIEQLSPAWAQLNRVIVITDEQSQDGIGAPPVPGRSYVINVAGYANGVSYRNGWHHIDGWSEGVFDYIKAVEEEQ